MAKITCSKCGKELQGDYPICPYCRTPRTTQTPWEAQKATTQSTKSVGTAKLMKCKTCGTQIAKTAKICPHCGGKNKKKASPFVIIVCFLFFCSIIGGASQKFSKEDSDDQSPSAPLPNVDVIMDLEQFSMVSLEELRAMLGSEGEKDPYGVTLTDTLHGVPVHLDIYIFNDGQLEFIIWDDKVVRGTYNAPSYWGGEPIHFEKKEDIPLMFGISVSRSAYTSGDTPMAYRIGNINDKVDNFWVTLMDNENNTFDQVKATYYKYFE